MTSGPNKRIVQKRPDGDYEVRVPGAGRASAVTRTQAEGIDRARDILANDGGGELQVRGLDGTIRKQDTIKPGNDPRGSKGKLGRLPSTASRPRVGPSWCDHRPRGPCGEAVIWKRSSAACWTSPG